MTHDHHHDHDHAPLEQSARMSVSAIRAAVLRDLLIEAGVFRFEDLRRTIDRIESRTPRDGARVVARAWTDDTYRTALLTDANAAVAELGIDLGETHLYVVANTPAVHNVVVCTLCSCYPKTLLGLPPDWYKSRSYRSRAVNEPREVLAEFGLMLPRDVEVRVHDSTADLRYLVLPMRPPSSEGYDEEALVALITRDCMIGTAVPTLEPENG